MQDDGAQRRVGMEEQEILAVEIHDEAADDVTIKERGQAGGRHVEWLKRRGGQAEQFQPVAAKAPIGENRQYMFGFPRRPEGKVPGLRREMHIAEIRLDARQGEFVADEGSDDFQLCGGR